MVAVLMSTYNGAAFLKEQLDSILNQTYSDFVLYIRDDNSTDDTFEILSNYDDPRIRLIRGLNLGPAGSFFALLQEALKMQADYLFFSDQDDVWFPGKLERMLYEIKKYDDRPAMVFSDFTMIDEKGNQIHPSYAQSASLQVSPGKVGVHKLIAQPYVFGCASVINKKLAEYVAEPPTGIEMHDCWISLTAASIGELIYIPEQTIAHRFHSNNATGKKDHTNFMVRLKRITSGFSKQTANTALRLHQVNLLLENYDGQLLPDVKCLLDDLAKAMHKGRLATVFKLKKLGIGRQKVINTLLFYLTVLGIKGQIQSSK